ncbi:Hemolysin containing CBS domains [Arcticibacter svalbardensis MN12-7]|uniref:Hemolysin containing CBS domains n=1 Tax=Arcticibacter svalbardensis MN12-7 TaxID=1150600 RepID=R9GNS9_9SPHI|nr:hemolysin family protein [Arcticibacter svalbardensis]EOR93383.1 Hemolysin containing CBS domains [Arcticibacter svalbardensis MN12-7]
MEILIIALLIILNGVFSMSEIALVSSRRFTLESAANKGNKNARKALELAGNPNTFLSTIQLGITLIGILTGIFSGEKLTAEFIFYLNQIPFLAPYAHTLSVIFIVFIITYFSIVFGELIPKRIGLAFPESISMLVASPMNILSAITKPFIWLLAKSSELVLGVIGIREKQDGIITEEEIKSIIADSTSVGEIQEIEEDIVNRVFALGDRKAGELMTHRSELTFLDINDDIAEIKSKIEANPHTIYPIINKSPDILIGLVSVNDIFTSSFSGSNFDLNSIIEKPQYVQENMPAYKVLEKFKKNRIHMVIVVDEYGSIQGALSITDVVEELLGDMSTDVKVDDLEIIQRNDTSWLADGQYPYYEFINYFGIRDEKDPEGFTTLGGLILENLHHYPVTGETIRWNKFDLEVVDMDGTRIDKIMITKVL